MTLNGSQREQIYEAILAAFDYSDLNRLTLFQFNQSLEMFSGSDLPSKVMSVIRFAEHNGFEEQLIKALIEKRPSHQAIQALSSLINPTPQMSQTSFGNPSSTSSNQNDDIILVSQEAKPLPPESPTSTPQPLSQSSITSPKVLISYSHDSLVHAARILALSNRLRADGIDCMIDQYVQNPSEGWPLWMDNQVETVNFVLMVFTERYTTRSMQPRQSGVRFESVLLLQELYEAGMINDKFIPVVLEQDDAQHIMKWFRPYNYYTIDVDDATDRGYDLLLRRLLDDPAITMPPLGMPRRQGPT